MPGDVTFYALAIPAILIVGLSKGGFGGGSGVLGVPMMASAAPRHGGGRLVAGVV